MTVRNHPRSHPLKKIALQTITAHRMLSSGDGVLAGVSGGPDSVAMAHILSELTPDFELRLALAHVNHGLRGESARRDAEFVRRLAERLQVPFYLNHTDVAGLRRQRRLSLEEAGRQARYDYYIKVAEEEGYQKIALGHQAEDNAELVLMNLFRGSGPTGLAGIPPVRFVKKTPLWVIRPLIRVERRLILDYLHMKKAPYVCDTSNRDPVHLRNRIRHDLMPRLMADYNPALPEALNRLAEILRTENEWIEAVLEPAFRASVLARHADEIALSADRLRQHPLAVRRRLFRRALEAVKGDTRKIRQVHVDALIGLCSGHPGPRRLHLPGRIRVLQTGDRIGIRQLRSTATEAIDASRSDTAADFSYRVTGPGRYKIAAIEAMLTIESLDGRLSMETVRSSGARVAFIDERVASFPLEIRNLRSGDRFTPLGMRGSQKVRRYFSNRKVPHSERNRSVLIVKNDRILWVAGHQVAESAKVTARTSAVLKLSIQPLGDDEGPEKANSVQPEDNY